MCSRFLKKTTNTGSWSLRKSSASTVPKTVQVSAHLLSCPAHVGTLVWHGMCDAGPRSSVATYQYWDVISLAEREGNNDQMKLLELALQAPISDSFMTMVRTSTSNVLRAPRSVKEMESLVLGTFTCSGTNDMPQSQRCSALLHFCVNPVVLHNIFVEHVKLRLCVPLCNGFQRDLRENSASRSLHLKGGTGAWTPAFFVQMPPSLLKCVRCPAHFLPNLHLFGKPRCCDCRNFMMWNSIDV